VAQEPGATLFAIPGEYKLVKEIVQQQLAQSSGVPDSAPPTNLAWYSGSPSTGIMRAGVAGVTQPNCIYCPNPSYSDEARAAKIQGTVILEVVVAAGGQAESVRVLRGPGSGLEQKAIEAIKEWRFKPAVGPSGTPVACRVAIAVTFKLG
jgi:TonB family protein